MGLRYQKRKNTAGGAGVNFSKSGASASYRNKFGSVGSKGFSLKTGIPGLSYRGSFGKSGIAVLIGLFIGVILFALQLSILIVWNVVALIVWIISLPINRNKSKN